MKNIKRKIGFLKSDMMEHMEYFEDSMDFEERANYKPIDFCNAMLQDKDGEELLLMKVILSETSFHVGCFGTLQVNGLFLPTTEKCLERYNQEKNAKTTEWYTSAFQVENGGQDETTEKVRFA